MKSTYIIGEIGQNHNGSIDIAKLMIDLVCRPIIEDTFNIPLRPIDAVKVTKRDLNQELSATEMERVYDSPHSFGRTYGEHRARLELNDQQHFELYKYAREKKVEFVETLCALGTLTLLKLFTPDYLKVASRDLTNIPLLHALAETKIPIIISTGMAGERELDTALECISRYHSNISILHCVSEYPAQPRNVNLNSIVYLKEKYPDFRIGYSDHTIGLSTSVAAVALGAEIVEKHITIDRSLKGTDQAGSLGPDGVFRMVRDIRLIEMSIGEKALFICESVGKSKAKLERSIATNKAIKKGEIIKVEDIHLLSPGDGIKWVDQNLIVGKRSIIDIQKNEIIYLKYLENV